MSLNEWLNVVSDKCVTNSKHKHKMESMESIHTINSIRYQRELNPYFRDDIEKKFVEKPNTLQTSDGNDGNTNTISNDSLMESNLINAKILKAEMMGNQQLANQLKTKLKQISQTNANTSVDSSTSSKHVYVNSKRLADDEYDESMSVKHMFLKAKRSRDSHETKLFVSSYSSKSLKSVEDEYECSHLAKQRQPQRHGQRSVGNDNDSDNDNACSQCVSNISRHLILMNGEHITVAFTDYEPFTYGYCYIQSVSHHNISTVSADEQCVAEITAIKRQISKLFAQQKLSVIFMETYFKRKKRFNRHLTIECVPIKSRKQTDLIMYFKKAIMECEHEWALNKKLIEINGKSIGKIIPKGLSYFYVTFGSENNGYAHVIEDENSFSPHFGKQVIGGFLDIEPQKWLKQKPQNYDQQYQRVIDLKILAKSSI